MKRLICWILGHKDATEENPLIHVQTFVCHRCRRIYRIAIHGAGR